MKKFSCWHTYRVKQRISFCSITNSMLSFIGQNISVTAPQVCEPIYRVFVRNDVRNVTIPQFSLKEYIYADVFKQSHNSTCNVCYGHNLPNVFPFSSVCSQYTSVSTNTFTGVFFFLFVLFKTNVIHSHYRRKKQFIKIGSNSKYWAFCFNVGRTNQLLDCCL